MPTIEINSQKLDFNESEFLNVKSILPKIQKNFPTNHYTYNEFKINGVAIDIDSEDPHLMRPITKEDHIQMTIQDNHTALLDIIGELNDLVERILKNITYCVELIEKEDFQYSLKLIQIIEAVDTFIYTANQTSKEITNLQEFHNAVPMKELQIHLLSVIKAIHSANHRKDFIMLTDLLEYELNDNLKQWKILILPILKQEISQKN